jgi:exodeoxyribonuclease VII large subunit
VPVRLELIAELEAKVVRLAQALMRSFNERRTHLAGLARGLPDPASFIGMAGQRLDDRAERLANALRQILRNDILRLKAATGRMSPASLRVPVERARERLQDLPSRLGHATARLIERQRAQVDGAAARLQSYRRALDQVLERGYAMVRVEGKLVTSAAEIAPGAALAIEFHDGAVKATAEGAPAAKRSKGKAAPKDQGKLLL